MKTSKVVQLNNDFIQKSNTLKRSQETEHYRRNRMMGWILVVTMLVFILPAYSLVSNYVNLREKETRLVELKLTYDDLAYRTKEEKELAKNLKETSYVEKYVRAKYYYSKDGEMIFPLPELVPK